ncbi:capsid cement protein [Bremerella sp. T1]|uniref:DUF2190 family protein n=1 Tax=Bremerella sp. TYQ1 TaxID=3119568 RepID=UPI001CC9933E|nr:DUF2190 family protein [Bremerella volcania]UBM38420.1 DUF2190 family protein [Bremerella volcania]
MSFEAKFDSGDPLMVDHVPAAAVAAGEVVVLADTVRIAHRAIAAGEKGALAACGGTYVVPKAAGGSTAIADGKKVYWDDANNRVTATASTHKRIGYAVGASLDADTSQVIEHAPGPAEA